MFAMVPEKADKIFKPYEAWMLEIGEEALHPDSNMPLFQLRFIKRSGNITDTGEIEWLAPRVGLGEQEILRFMNYRVKNLTSYPKVKAT